VERKGYEIYRQFQKSITLTDNMRAEKDEIEFKGLLDRVRLGVLLPQDLKALKERDVKFLLPDERAEYVKHAIIVYPDV